MNSHVPPARFFPNRRRFLWNVGGGLGGLALAHLLGQEGLLADVAKPHSNFNGGLHHRARARRVVQLFMSGAASQCDTFDYKPALDQEERREVRSRRQGRAVSKRAGRRDAKPLEVAAARPVRQVDERPGSPPGRLRR